MECYFHFLFHPAMLQLENDYKRLSLYLAIQFLPDNLSQNKQLEMCNIKDDWDNLYGSGCNILNAL